MLVEKFAGTDDAAIAKTAIDGVSLHLRFPDADPASARRCEVPNPIATLAEWKAWLQSHAASYTEEVGLSDKDCNMDEVMVRIATIENIPKVCCMQSCH